MNEGIQSPRRLFQFLSFKIFFNNKGKMRTTKFLKDDFMDYSNPSKIKILKTCIRLSSPKPPLRSPLRQLPPMRDKSVQLLQKCKQQLSKKNFQLMRSIEQKEEKVEQLRDTFRRIQRSKSRNPSPLPSPVPPETPQSKPSTYIPSSTLISKTKLFSR